MYPNQRQLLLTTVYPMIEMYVYCTLVLLHALRNEILNIFLQKRDGNKINFFGEAPVFFNTCSLLVQCRRSARGLQWTVDMFLFLLLHPKILLCVQ